MQSCGLPWLLVKTTCRFQVSCTVGIPAALGQHQGLSLLGPHLDLKICLLSVLQEVWHFYRKHLLHFHFHLSNVSVANVKTPSLYEIMMGPVRMLQILYLSVIVTNLAPEVYTVTYIPYIKKVIFLELFWWCLLHVGHSLVFLRCFAIYWLEAIEKHTYPQLHVF